MFHPRCHAVWGKLSPSDIFFFFERRNVLLNHLDCGLDTCFSKTVCAFWLWGSSREENYPDTGTLCCRVSRHSRTVLGLGVLGNVLFTLRSFLDGPFRVSSRCCSLRTAFCFQGNFFWTVLGPLRFSSRGNARRSPAS